MTKKRGYYAFWCFALVIIPHIKGIFKTDEANKDSKIPDYLL